MDDLFIRLPHTDTCQTANMGNGILYVQLGMVCLLYLPALDIFPLQQNPVIFPQADHIGVTPRDLHKRGIRSGRQPRVFRARAAA